MAARTKQIGVSGLRQNSGYIYEEWDRRLRSIRARRDTWQQMQHDATIAAAIRAIDALARSTDYQLDPADDAPPEVHEHVKDCLDSMDGSWGDKLSEILSLIPYGFSLFEIVHMLRDDGMIVWERWAPRGQETIDRWDYDAEGREWTAAIQVNPNNGHQYVLPRNVLLHFVTVSRKQSPEGESYLRPAFDSWYYVKHIQRIEANGIERDYTGWPHVEVPQEVWDDPTLLADWQAVIAGMRNGEESGIVTPSTVDENGNKLYSFNVVTSAGSRNIDTDTVINRHKTDMLRNLLADWLKLGDEGGGSYALGVSKAEAFAAFVQSILDSIADTIVEQAIKPLVVLNGWPEEYAPTFRFESLIKRDVPAIVESLVKLIGSGVIDSGRAEVQTLGYELMALPIPEEGFEDEAADDAMIDRVTGGVADPNALQPGDVPVEDKEPNDKTFTEPLPDDWMAQGRIAWDQVVPEKYVGLLDAEVA
jgi:hypothetical protein